ncbi:MAG: hypothetical protein ACKOZU_09940 [Planctomycetaceae bacterium]
MDGKRLELSSREEHRALDRALRMNFNEGEILVLRVRRKPPDGGDEPVEVDLRLVAK